jgi:hypothetical protein
MPSSNIQVALHDLPWKRACSAVSVWDGEESKDWRMLRKAVGAWDRRLNRDKATLAWNFTGKQVR